MINKVIHYNKQYIDEDDINSVVEVMKSDYLTTGPKIEEFEKKLCEFTGYKFCKVCNSGTSALHLALLAIHINTDDEIIIPSISFVATANIVIYCSAKPVFCDISERDLLIDVNKIEKLITKRTKAIIAVDYAGKQCDYKELRKICDKYNLVLISDACHSFGSITKSNDFMYADIVCYSFHPVKNITTGEGGAMLTNNSVYNHIAYIYRNHGRNFINNIVAIGHNYRMNDISAALGISQLKKIHTFLNRRINIAKKYDSELKVKKIPYIKNVNHTYHLYNIFIENREKFIEYMKDNNIICGTHYLPIYRQFAYMNYFLEEGIINCPITEIVYKYIVTIPLYFSLTDEEQNYIIEKINNYIENERR